MKNKRLNNKGFSLVELIVVIAIMAILAVTLAPKLTQYIDKARRAGDQEAITSIYTAAKLANAEFPLGDSIAAGTIVLKGTNAYNDGTAHAAVQGMFMQDSATPQKLTLNSAYSVTGHDDFIDAMIASLSGFTLKEPASMATILQISTNSDGNITVTLSYDGTIGGTDDIKLSED